MNPAHLDPRLQTLQTPQELIDWANKNTVPDLQAQLQAAMGDRITVTIDRERFTQTRNALTSAYIGLSNAVDKAVKAYIDHTDVILQGEGTLDISHLLNPFTGAVGAAQTAEFNIANGLHAVNTGTAEVLANGDPKKRQKRPYKQRDPNAPKRPLTAYFRYLKEVRPLIAAEVQNNPPSDGIKAGDISKIATERWKALGDAKRKPYHQAYQSELAAYEAAVKEYKAAGGKVDDVPKTPGDEDEEEDDQDDEKETPAKITAAADESSSSDDSSSDEEETDSEEEVPVKPPPPPPEAPKKKKSRKSEVAATPVTAVPPPPAPMSAPERVSSKKRKAPAGEETPSTEKKKKKKNRKSDVDPASAQLQLESSQPSATPGVEKKEKKKKRKSEAA